MRRSDFYFELPPALIAQYPTSQRSQSRLLCLDGQSGDIEDREFTDLLELLQAGDLLVFNDTRVIPARLLGHKDSGGKVEVLVERLLDDRRALGYVRASKAPKIGSRFTLTNQTAAPASATVLGRKDDLFELCFEDNRSVLEIVETLGHTPLPPYISRPADQADDERYQTVYARHKGAVAAPTAGLHFDRPLLDLLAQRGIESAYVTLHVGAGTFHPLRVDTIEEHKMHSEWAVVPEQVCAQVRATRARGGRVIAVGTTSARALESAAQGDELQPFQGETTIFIYPGYRFRTLDAMITNFHLPESTLLMLVCAFAGTARVLAAYRHAVATQYRFFSYGDAMFVLPQIQDTKAK